MIVYVLLNNKAEIDSDRYLYLTNDKYFSLRLDNVINCILDRWKYERCASVIIAQVEITEGFVVDFIKSVFQNQPNGLGGFVQKVYEFNCYLPVEE